MGIKVEFNPDLALRAHGTKGRLEKECLPETLRKGQEYPFLKEGQRLYWLLGTIPLLETQGNEILSRPLASIRIKKATHVLGEGDKIYTEGIYEVVEVYDKDDPTVHFESYKQLL